MPRVVLAMIDEEREKSTRPRRLAPRIRSEFDRLCDELGGPADIGAAIGSRRIRLSMYCTEYSSHRVLPVLLQYQSDESLARRHWPWAAFAISQFVWERQERKEYTDEPTPVELKELLSQIKQAAHDLLSKLSGLETLALRLRDPADPLHRGHIAWLDAIVSQAAAGHIGNEVNEAGEDVLAIHSGKIAFLKRLVDIEVAVKIAMDRFDRTLLKRKRGQSEPALPNFIFRCGVIWKNLTGRNPSANKVARGDPHFVAFIQGLAKLGQVCEPTRNQVATCLGKTHTPAIRKKKHLK